MKKLTIVFTDNSKVIYTMKNSVSFLHYLGNHSKNSIKSAILQQYPKKDHEPLILV